MAFAETAPLVAQLDLKGNFTPTLKKASSALSSFGAKLDQTQSRASRASRQIGTGIKNLGKLAAASTAALGAIVIASAKVAADFESQLNIINTVARQSPEALGKVGDSIRAISRATGTATDELTAGYYDLVSAGIKAADATNVLTQANTLAIGGLSTAGEAIDLLTTAINTYGGDASRAAEYTDVFAKAIERGKVTAADLAGSFAQVGPIAASSGINIQELGAAYARLTASGVPAAEAATDVRSAIVALTKLTSPLEGLQKATGKNYLAIAGDKGLVVALEEMRIDAAKAGIPLIELLGRVEGLNFTLATTGPNLGAYNADLAAMGDAAGTAAGQMSERQKGLNFQLSRISALTKDAQISLGTALLPSLTNVAEALATTLSDPAIGQSLTQLGQEISSLFTSDNIRNGIQAVKELAPVVVSAARTMASIIGTTVNLFRSLPPEIQALAVGAFAINKLTGGLITNVAGGLISSVLKQLVSGVVNVNGGVVNVNGAGGLGGAAGAAGIGTGLALTTIGAAVAATVISTQDLLAKTTLEERRRNGGLRAQQYQGSAAAMNKPIPIVDVTPGLVGNFGRNAPNVNPPALRAEVLERAVAKGFHPSAASIERTLRNNAEHASELVFYAKDAADAARGELFATKETTAAVRALPMALKNALGGVLFTGGGRPSKDDRVLPGRPSVQSTQDKREGNLTVKVSSSIRDQNTAGDVRRRFGPTVTQAGAG